MTQTVNTSVCTQVGESKVANVKDQSAKFACVYNGVWIHHFLPEEKNVARTLILNGEMMPWQSDILFNEMVIQHTNLTVVSEWNTRLIPR